MTFRPRTVVIGTCLTLLTFAPTAHAGLPKFSDTLIVINKSLAGVKLGSTVSAAKKAWGKPTYCDITYCNYRKTKTDTASGWGAFAQKNGTVFNSQLVAPRSDTTLKYSFVKPFTVPKTSKGIGIGSTLKALKKAYPKAVNEGGSYVFRKGSRYQTNFDVDPKSKRIYQIRMADLVLAQS